MGVAWRGRSGHGDGVHVLTGPVWVCGAEPGDVLQVTVVSGAVGCTRRCAAWGMPRGMLALQSGWSSCHNVLAGGTTLAGTCCAVKGCLPAWSCG